MKKWLEHPQHSSTKSYKTQINHILMDCEYRILFCWVRIFSIFKISISNMKIGNHTVNIILLLILYIKNMLEEPEYTNIIQLIFWRKYSHNSMNISVDSILITRFIPRISDRLYNSPEEDIVVKNNYLISYLVWWFLAP